MTTVFEPAVAEIPLDPVQQAVEYAKRDLQADPTCDVHSVGEGLVLRDGVLQRGVIAKVSQKRPLSALKNVKCAPRSYRVDGVPVPVDVREVEPPSVLKLMLDSPLAQTVDPHSAQHQKCYNCPVPGGVQIAPQGANYVGTFGCLVRCGDLYCILSNDHVLHDRFPVGTPIGQPSGNAPAIAKLTKWNTLVYGGQTKNYCDVAVADCKMSDGRHSCANRQVTIGEFRTDYLDPQIGMPLTKDGRTTGRTQFTCTEINTQTTVNYGPNGMCLFDRQAVGRAQSGYASQAGDSGSVIFHAQTLQPVGLLFAGGGMDTIFTPISFIIQWIQQTFGSGGFFR